jgi:hypothetical protein
VGVALFQSFEEEEEEEEEEEKKKNKQRKRRKKKEKWLAMRSEPIIVEVNNFRSFHSVFQNS